MKNEILLKLDEIHSVFLECGFKRGLKFRKQKIENATPCQLEEARQYLLIFNIYIAEYRRIRSLVDPGVWEIYAMTGLRSGTFELDELAKIKNVLDYQWRLRPNILQVNNGKSKEDFAS